MTTKTIYTAHAIVKGGREGRAETDDKALAVEFCPPNSDKLGTNPEQLFACGYASCFGSAMAHVAREQKVDIGTPEIKADVHLHQGDGGFSISVDLDVSLPDMDKKAAEKLVATAHTVCPYSKAVKGNVDVTLKVNHQPLSKAA
jgi:lipoyl-dependent peroxiredoxin